MEAWVVGQKRRTWFALSHKDRFLVRLYRATPLSAHRVFVAYLMKKKFLCYRAEEDFIFMYNISIIS
ncbi:hypothetical protein HPY31_05155 [Brevibacillus sp. HB1.3]|uniref:hypothetical protein n=1 Tax=Brevibacillus sp. HB1.3 TaxID=2738842 RepID=UPI001551DBBF|nr:hypothetical protein [Brevibacillus sp. HB1.3]NQF13306.1 hypothetical protein [Brevibacillus sp. HB1.3]